MRKLITILALFGSLASMAQDPTNYTKVQSRYNWLAGYFRALNIPADSAVGLKTGQWPGDGAIMADTLGGDAGIYYYLDSAWVRIADTTDLGPDISNLGSSYRLWDPVTPGLKTLAAGTGISIDSSTANTITITLDTNFISTRAWRQKGIDSVASLIGSGSSTAPSTVSITETSTLRDVQEYSAFPSAAWTDSRDTAWITYKESQSHAAEDTILIQQTFDGGATWSDPWQIGGTLEASTISAGMGENGRLVFAWNNGTDYDTVRFGYSDNGGLSLTEVDSVAISSPLEAGVPYGHIIRMPSGKLYCPGYGWNATTDSSYGFLFQSTDNGATWSQGPIVIRSFRSGTFPQGTTSETSVVVATEGATDATTTMVAITRSDTYKGRHYHSYSSDGGETWTNTAVSSAVWAFGNDHEGAVENSWPVGLIRQGGKIHAIHTIRNLIANGGFAIRTHSMPVSGYDDPANWSPYKVVYREIGHNKVSNNDWGYAAPFLTPQNDIRTAFYGASISHRTSLDGTSTPKRLVIKSMPIVGLNIYEARNDASQAIPTGTETTVTFPDPWLDSEGFYDSDSAKIYITSDGVWDISVKLQLDTSSYGTKRIVRLYAIDWGALYGTSSQDKAYHLLDQKFLSPSTVDEANYVQLSGLRKWLYDGMEIRVTVEQDTGNNLNIVNTTTDNYIDGARIYIKKIE